MYWEEEEKIRGAGENVIPASKGTAIMYRACSVHMSGKQGKLMPRNDDD